MIINEHNALPAILIILLVIIMTAAGAITGAVVGAAIGHTLAEDSHSQAATTLIGGVMGMVIGSNVADGRVRVHHHHHVKTEPVSRQICEYEIRRHANIIGYQVRYRFNGQTIQLTQDNPGRNIRLKIQPMID